MLSEALAQREHKSVLQTGLSGAEPLMGQVGIEIGVADPPMVKNNER
jgi:hypothetical protein